jgi:hypothetical protein
MIFDVPIVDWSGYSEEEICKENKVRQERFKGCHMSSK